jgi:hypothetical protein
LGGIRYDIAEIQLRDKKGEDKHFLRVRASGTEPINRIYVESSDSLIACKLMQTTLNILESLSIQQLDKAESMWRLVDILCQTHPNVALVRIVKDVLARRKWQSIELIERLKTAIPTLENRIQKIAQAWVDQLA